MIFSFLKAWRKSKKPSDLHTITVIESPRLGFEVAPLLQNVLSAHQIVARHTKLGENLTQKQLRKAGRVLDVNDLWELEENPPGPTEILRRALVEIKATRGV